MVTAIPQAERIGKLLRLLGSNVEGEVAATVAALARVMGHDSAGVLGLRRGADNATTANETPAANFIAVLPLPAYGKRYFLL